MLVSFWCRSWSTETRQEAITYPPLGQAVKDYQDPAQADKITKIQRELDETTEILVSATIQSYYQMVVMVQGMHAYLGA